MKCSKCKTKVDHHLSYEFDVDGHTIVMCDECRAKYLDDKMKAEYAAYRRTLESRRLKKK